MVRSYRVKVNGRLYQVEVEEGEQPGVLTESTEQPHQYQEKVKTDSKSGNVSAPITGKVLEVKVKVGELVDEGTLLLVLEAMKMENELFAPRKGKIKNIYVSKDQVVAEGDILLSIE